MLFKKILSWIVFFLLLAFCSLTMNAQCSTTGALNGGAFSSNPTVGTTSWTSPSNTVTSNGVASMSGTTVPAGATITTNYLYVQNFGFNVPANASICGIAVKIEHKQQGDIGASTSVKDHSIYLTTSSGLTGTNHAYTWEWTGFYSNIVHGSSSDNWGTTLTAADINSPNFGVAISADLQSSTSTLSMSADIDHVSMTLFFTIPLPVELLDFHTAVANNREVSIFWSTATENNNDYFSIERSTDAIHWEEIEKVQGAGNSNNLINYSTSDKDPYMGQSYYRLKQTDANGDFYYSDVSTVNITQSGGITINYESGNIQVNTKEGDALSVNVYDYSGIQVKNTSWESASENTSIQVDDLRSGMYIVVAESAGQKEIRKFFLP